MEKIYLGLFQKPEAILPWTGIMKCKRYRSRAPQKDFFWDRIDLRVGKNEDCLYLNIITPGWKPQPEFVCHILFNYFLNLMLHSIAS